MLHPFVPAAGVMGITKFAKTKSCVRVESLVRISFGFVNVLCQLYGEDSAQDVSSQNGMCSYLFGNALFQSEI